MIIIVFIYIKDKFEKEPIGFLFKNFLMGAIVSIIITIILGTIAAMILPLTDVKSVSQQFIQAFVVVALVEEFSKYIIARYYAQRNAEFNEPFDGIVYTHCYMVLSRCYFACGLETCPTFRFKQNVVSPFHTFLGFFCLLGA